MKTDTSGQQTDLKSDNPQDEILGTLEKSASAILRLIRRIKAAEERGGDALTAHPAVCELRQQVAALKKLDIDLARSEETYAERSDKQFLELEAVVREACNRQRWRVDGQWPTLYVERAISVEVAEEKRVVIVAGKKLPIATARQINTTLEPLVHELIPSGFSPREFMQELSSAYDATATQSLQLPAFDLYRAIVVRSQSARFWRDAKADSFKGLSVDQFRARLTATLEAGVTSAPDGREVRFLPPLNPKDGLFIYQPAESRFGFVGRIEFVQKDRQ